MTQSIKNERPTVAPFPKDLESTFREIQKDFNHGRVQNLQDHKLWPGLQKKLSKKGFAFLVIPETSGDKYLVKGVKTGDQASAVMLNYFGRADGNHTPLYYTKVKNPSYLKLTPKNENQTIVAAVDENETTKEIPEVAAGHG